MKEDQTMQLETIYHDTNSNNYNTQQIALFSVFSHGKCTATIPNSVNWQVGLCQYLTPHKPATANNHREETVRYGCRDF